MPFHEATFSKLNKIKEYIDSNYGEVISIDQIGINHTVSPPTLRTGFKEIFGEYATDYRTRIRLHEAKKLLKETETPIKTIAKMVGYVTKQSFLNFFRRSTGLTPGAYRKSTFVGAPKPMISVKENQDRKWRMEFFWENGTHLGHAYQEVDGFYVFVFPDGRNGAFEAHVLRSIADQLDKMNEPWQKQIENIPQ